jgi:myosin-3
MLRKTTHQRNSMKRTPMYDPYDSSEPSGFRSARNIGHESNVVYRSRGNRSESPEWNPDDMVRMSEKYGRQGGRNDLSEAEETVSVTAELAPGIVVEGYVADL